jgi:hypothetical protein
VTETGQISNEAGEGSIEIAMVLRWLLVRESWINMFFSLGSPEKHSVWQAESRLTLAFLDTPRCQKDK